MAQRRPRGARPTILWMACAQVYGLPDFTLGDSDMHTTALDGASFK